MEAMRQPWPDNRIDELNRKVDVLAQRVDAGFARIEERFERVDEKFERLYRVLIAFGAAMFAAMLGTLGTMVTIVVTRI